MEQRFLAPEILDSLPHDHPDALASRSDIRFLNSMMGSFFWLRRQLAEHVLESDQIVELGAGDGGLVRYVGNKFPFIAARWTGLDFAPEPTNLPAQTSWVQGDFFSEDAAGEALQNANVVVANLILHHFTDAQLKELATRFKSARLLIISEPARYIQHYWKGKLLNAIFGFNYVTMYDMLLSLRAGFQKGELPKTLGLNVDEWDVDESHTFTGACRLVAVRKVK